MQVYKFIYADGSTEQLEAERVSPTEVVIKETSLIGECAFGDRAEVEEVSSGVFMLKRIIAPSALVVSTVFLTEHQAMSASLGTLLRRIEDEGGHWERALGGLLIVHLPPTSRFDLESAIRLLL